MPDADFIMCDVPKESMDLVITTWADFKRNPSDYDKFRTIDWVINVAFRKWQTYADMRKASAA